MHVYVTHWKRKIVNVTKFVDCSLFYQIFASAFMTMDCNLLWNSHTTWNTYRVYVHQNKMNSTKKSTCPIISSDFYNLIYARLPWIVPIKDFAACIVTRKVRSFACGMRNSAQGICNPWLVPSRLFLSLRSGARGVMGFDSFLFPSHLPLLPPRALREDDWGRVSSNPANDWNPETKLCWQGVRNRQRRIRESIYVSGKLLTCPSPKPTFCPKREVIVNVGLWEG